ncbi:MAG TPA: hypothetical protein VOA41_15850, partial [Candidatus Dormibacteraeota bacterium]|nr:hypothetical protein [Candidatus Dormibacteraeota bacterium]
AAAAQAAADRDPAAVVNHFQNAGRFLENRGTKVDTHVHMIDFGYLALLLALVQPWVALSEIWKKRLAIMFLFGSGLLPVGVFLIHYVGLAYSPLQAIGWASIFADLGGLLVVLVCAGELLGLWRHFRNANANDGLHSDGLLCSRTREGRILLVGGTVLILTGFFHGAYYAAIDLYNHEALDSAILSNIAAAASSSDASAIAKALADYGHLQGDKAVKIAAHSHIIEFGLLAIMLAFIQPYVELSAKWKCRWAALLLLGSLMLPVFVLLELRYGLVAGGLADVGGLFVMIALFAMWAGIFRYTGRLDALAASPREVAIKIPGNVSTPPITKTGVANSIGASRRILLSGGFALAVLGMAFGLWYAVFAEHQALDRIGSSLAASFVHAAERNVPDSQAALKQYTEAQYIYVRDVDVHGHWIGLAMLLIVLGIAFNRVSFAEPVRVWLALGIFLGAFLFPFGVFLQTLSHGLVPRALAIAGSAIVLGSLSAITLGFARAQDANS